MKDLFSVAKLFYSKAGVLAGLILFSSLTAIAQQVIPAKKRPTLGLALQGGGALGLAHVGVITWMEEHHIPVDYISGTSMGGLVGGVYATGRNAAELRQIVNGINWDEVMAGQTPFDDLSFRRKEDARDYPSQLEFGLRKGVQFPAGFNSGQQVSLILDKVALPYSEINSFNDLPIPFACVATDLVSGKPKVFRSGSLALALRSTMSLPGIFTPVRDDGAIYADGGLLENLPVAVAKKMGADVVLGVHLAEETLKPDANLSSFAVLGQSISVMISANELQSMEMADILLSVPVQKWGALSFDDADAIIKAGYDAAAAKSKVLMTLSVDDATWNAYIAERNARRITTAPTPTFVAVEGVNKNLSQNIETVMAEDLGKPVDYDELENQIMRLKGTGRFAVLNYQLTREDGKQGLLIKTEENAYGPPVVRPLILVDGASLKNVTFNLGARVTWYDVGGFRSEWRNDIILFSQYGLRSEYYHPFTPKAHWFIAPRAQAYSDPIYFYDNNQLVATYRQNFLGGGIDLGYQFGTTGELRLGYEGGWQGFERQVGPQELITPSGGYGAARLQYRLDRLDTPVIPRQGQAAFVDFRFTNTAPLATGQYPALEVGSQNFFKLSEPSSVFLSGFAGTTFNNYNSGLPQFSLGGSRFLVSYGPNELLMDKYFLFQLGYLRQLAKLPPLLGGGVYFLGMYEAAQVYGPPSSMINKASGFPTDGAVGLVVNTIFGPVEAAYAYGDTGHHKFFFRIGRLF
ncbi:MAG TPA: patatin-like phospholipase family protein [Candidatus Eisenbacteria bacterium]|nr:patatin-like phospholipase family protein [Candidatus Eisenbacteria bacterium]